MIDGLTVVGRWRERRVVVAAGCVAMAVVATACGGDDVATPASSSPGRSASAEGVSVTSIAAPTSDGPVTGAAPEPAAEPADEPSGDPSDAGLGDCPPADAVSAAWGRPFELDDESAMTGAVGLVFCPYEEVIAPGTTDQFGLEPIGDFFSITMTDQNPVVDDPTADRVHGLGEQGTWYPGAGELSVWSGERGVIVSVPFTPDDVDAFALAATLAGSALEVDASGASVTAADPDDVAAAAAEQAAGCPDPVELGATAGRELVLAAGAIVDEGEGMCPYLAAGDDPYSFMLTIGFSRDDFYPIEPDEPTEDIDGLGESAIWQPGYDLLVVWTDERRVSVQVSGVDLSKDDERAVALAVAEGLV